MREWLLKSPDFEWIDVIAPKRDEFEILSQEFAIPLDQVKDCLDHGHLPKYEKRDKWHFAILRNYDEEATDEGDTIQELTRKIAIFYSGKTLITVRRKEQGLLLGLKNRLVAKETTGANGLNAPKVLGELFRVVVESYVHPIEKALEEIDSFEKNIFLGSGVPQILESLYYLKRKASIYRRMIRIHGDLLKQTVTDLNFPPVPVSELRDEVDRVFFLADTLQESTMHLFNAHVSLSSQKTNEVMRVLTVFSVFFMPLTFIVGIYGMNFTTMPEITHPKGYIAVWILMIFTCIVLAWWFRSRGWLQSSGQTPDQKPLDSDLKESEYANLS